MVQRNIILLSLKSVNHSEHLMDTKYYEIVKNSQDHTLDPFLNFLENITSQVFLVLIFYLCVMTKCGM